MVQGLVFAKSVQSISFTRLAVKIDNHCAKSKKESFEIV